MKLLFQEYGRVVISIAAGTAILFLIFNAVDIQGRKGLIPVFADRITQTVRRNNLTGHMRPEVKVEVGNPDIFYMRENAFADQDYDLEHWFYGVDYKSENVVIKIHDIWDAEGNSLWIPDAENQNSFRFPTAGVYKIRVSAQDDRGKRTTVFFRIPILGAREVFVSGT
ncbi:MAG: hypothetical protein ACK5ML_10790 [Lachnospiraceae bacterium]